MIDELLREWSRMKDKELTANIMRRRVEDEIIEKLGVDINQRNANKKYDDVNIEFGFRRTWDQQFLLDIKPDIPDELWPFRTEYKEIMEKSRYVENNEPETWNKFSAGLIILPSRPYFKMKGDK